MTPRAPGSIVAEGARDLVVCWMQEQDALVVCWMQEQDALVLCCIQEQDAVARCGGPVFRRSPTMMTLRAPRSKPTPDSGLLHGRFVDFVCG